MYYHFPLINQKIVHTEPQPNFKPDVKPNLACEPLDDKTTHRVDFVRWPLDQQIKQKEKEPYHPPAGEMSCETTHRVEFTRKPLDVIQVQKKVNSTNDLPTEDIPPQITFNYKLISFFYANYNYIQLEISSII